MQDWEPVVFNKTKSTKSSPKQQKPPPKYREDEDGMIITKSLPKDFGQKMAAARAAKGWTQKDLAKRLNCQLSEIQEYEQNRVTNPNRAFARKIEKSLGGNLF